MDVARKKTILSSATDSSVLDPCYTCTSIYLYSMSYCLLLLYDAVYTENKIM